MYSLNCLRGALPKSVFVAEKQWVGFSEKAEVMPKAEDFVGPFLFPGMVEEFVTEGAEGLWIATGGSEPVDVQCRADPDASLQHQGVGVEGVEQPSQGGGTLFGSGGCVGGAWQRQQRVACSRGPWDLWDWGHRGQAGQSAEETWRDRGCCGWG